MFKKIALSVVFATMLTLSLFNSQAAAASTVSFCIELECSSTTLTFGGVTHPETLNCDNMLSFDGVPAGEYSFYISGCGLTSSGSVTVDGTSSYSRIICPPSGWPCCPIGCGANGDYKCSCSVPTAPALTVTTSGTTVSLSWTSVAGADGYTLYYAPYPKADSIGNIPMGTQTSLSASLPDGTAFYVAIQAYNGVGNSGYSNIEYFIITSTEFTMMTNPTDSEILSATGSDGTTVHYYGDRDDDGIPTSIDRFDVVDADGTSTMIQLDSENRPKRMRTSDGFVFELAYIGNDQAAVQVLSPDGSVQVNTSFVIGTGAESTSHVESMVGEHATGGDAVCDIKLVDGCGAGVTDADVTVTLSEPGSIFISKAYFAKHVSDGTYKISLPTNLRPSLNAEALRKAAEFIAAELAFVCTVLSGTGHPEHYLSVMCPALVYVALPTGPGAISLGLACAKVSAAVISYCAVLGNGGLPGNTSFAEQLLTALQDPNVKTGDVTIQAIAYTPGGISGHSATLTAPAAGPFPRIEITVVDGSHIGSLTLSPESPFALEPYEITTQMVCPNPGDYLTIDVVRSDDRDVPVEYHSEFPSVDDGLTTSFMRAFPGGGNFGPATDTVTATLTNRYGDIVDSRIAKITIPKAMPIIYDISPKKGPPGTIVTITGANFGPFCRMEAELCGWVLISGIMVPATSWKVREVITTIPAGLAPGAVSVNLYDSYGEASNIVYFEVESPTPGWDGGCSKNPCSSLYFKRPTSKGGPHGDYNCPYQAEINAESWADINLSSAPRSQDEIYKTLQDDSHNLTSIEKIQMGTLTGWFGESELIYDNGYYDGGYVSSGITSYGRGWVINEEGDFAVRLMYNVGGYGCFNNTQKDFMEAEGKAAKTEAQAIMKSIRLSENGDLVF